MNRKIFEKIIIFFQMIFEIFWILFCFFLIGVGPKLARPKDNLIILPLHAEMNSACSGLNEEGGNAGKRKLPGLGVSDVLRMSGRWLRKLRLRWRWPESAVRGRRKSCRGERRADRRRERAVVAAWWSVGGCVGFLRWSWWSG